MKWIQTSKTYIMLWVLRSDILQTLHLDRGRMGETNIPLAVLKHGRNGHRQVPWSWCHTTEAIHRLPWEEEQRWTNSIRHHITLKASFIYVYYIPNQLEMDSFNLDFISLSNTVTNNHHHHHQHHHLHHHCFNTAQQHVDVTCKQNNELLPGFKEGFIHLCMHSCVCIWCA